MKISEKKIEKISEQVLALLYSIAPKFLFTAHIAQEIARDEEFIKKILLGLKDKGFVVEIKKNSKGVIYLRRSRWKISDIAYQAYKQNQPY
jgi:ribosomal protein S25